jgi:hypothetical protein
MPKQPAFPGLRDAMKVTRRDRKRDADHLLPLMS